MSEVTTKQSGSQVVLGNVFFANGMRMPCHFDQNPQNRDLLIPDLHAIVTIYGTENKPTVQWGEFPRDTWQAGKFITPYAACWIWTVNFSSSNGLPKGLVPSLRKSSAEDEINKDRSKEN
jgi:hypothetical protein